MNASQILLLALPLIAVQVSLMLFALRDLFSPGRVVAGGSKPVWALIRDVAARGSREDSVCTLGVIALGSLRLRGEPSDEGTQLPPEGAEPGIAIAIHDPLPPLKGTQHHI